MTAEDERKAVLNFLDHPGILVQSWTQTIWPKMGDRVAVAILKATFGQQELSDTMVNKILHLVRAAFAAPAEVEAASDRIPAVTLRLLDWLKDLRPDLATRICSLAAEVSVPSTKKGQPLSGLPSH